MRQILPLSSRGCSNLTALALLAAISFQTLQGQHDLSIVDVGRIDLPSGSSGAGELSGLTWAGGDLYYAVSDSNRIVYPLSIELNRVTGFPASILFGTPLLLDTGSDLEGIAFNAGNDSIYVSDETGPGVREHSLADGGLLQAVPVDPVYLNIRPNFSLESLSLQEGHRSLWTTNEEALALDGPLSTVGEGTVVRLQRYSGDLLRDGQWAYVTDGITKLTPLIDEERSGLSDLVVLPDGRLIILERELGGVGLLLLPEFRNRIYLVDFTNATDVTGFAELEGATYTPTAKKLLWEKTFSFCNFEGMALGRQLDDGSRSLLLISDDGGGLSQCLHALRLYGAEPRLSQGPLIRGQLVDLSFSSLESGEQAHFLFSLSGTGTGPRVPQRGGFPLELLLPVQQLGNAVADSSGTATLTLLVPAVVPLVSVATQAVVQREFDESDSLKSNAVLDQIQP